MKWSKLPMRHRPFGGRRRSRILEILHAVGIPTVAKFFPLPGDREIKEALVAGATPLP
jgi:hypothetical protein